MEAPKVIYLREYLLPMGNNSFSEYWQEKPIETEHTRAIKYIRADYIDVADDEVEEPH